MISERSERTIIDLNPPSKGSPKVIPQSPHFMFFCFYFELLTVTNNKVSVSPLIISKSHQNSSNPTLNSSNLLNFF